MPCWRRRSSISLQHLRLRRDVEGGRRLVGDEELRLERERDRDHHPLALAAGEFVRIGAGEPRRVGQADLVEQRDARAGIRSAASKAAVRREGFGDLVADAHHRVERGHRLLEDHADIAPAHRAQAASSRPSRSRPASRIEPGPRRTPRGRRPMTARAGIDLPEPEFADDAKGLAGCDREGQVLYRVAAIREPRQGQGEVVDGEDRGSALCLLHGRGSRLRRGRWVGSRRD